MVQVCIKGCSKNLISRKVNIVIYTDASRASWGGTNGINSISGRLFIENLNCHINELELLTNDLHHVFNLSALYQITQQSHLIY